MTDRTTLLLVGGVAAFALWQWQRANAEAEEAQDRADELEALALAMSREAQASNDYAAQLESSAQSEALISELPEEDEDEYLDLKWLGHIGP